MQSFDKGRGNAAQTKSSENKGSQQEASMPLRHLEVVTLASNLSAVQSADNLIGKVVLMELKDRDVTSVIRKVVSLGGRSFYSMQELHPIYLDKDTFYFLSRETTLLPVEKAIIREASEALREPRGSSLKIYSEDELNSRRKDIIEEQSQRARKEHEEFRRALARDFRIELLLAGSVLAMSAWLALELYPLLKQQAISTYRESERRKP